MGHGYGGPAGSSGQGQEVAPCVGALTGVESVLVYRPRSGYPAQIDEIEAAGQVGRWRCPTRAPGSNTLVDATAWP
jgi:hypothetical protein